MPFSAAEAKTRLEAVANPDWANGEFRLHRVLSPKLHKAATRMFGHNMQGWVDRRPEDLIEWLDLSTKQRIRIFNAAVPGRGRLLNDVWQVCDRLPYQTGWTRRSFRAPADPQLQLGRRVEAVRSLYENLGKYSGDVPWFAAWSGYIQRSVSLALAADIEYGPSGDETMAVLIDTINGTHPFGIVSRDAIKALLTCSRPEAWDAVEGLLLAAQRQEGVRSVILEAIDEGHPDAFDKFIGTINEHNLTRFASTVRAAGVWMGMGSDMTGRKAVENTLGLIANTISTPESATGATRSDDPNIVYAGLWTLAFRDVSTAIDAARPLLSHVDPGIRLAAVHLLAEAKTRQSLTPLIDMLADEDRRVAARAFAALQRATMPVHVADIERYLARINKKETLDPLVWDWMVLEEDPGPVVRMMLTSTEVDPVEAHQYLAKMDANTRSFYVRELHEAPKSEKVRRALIDLASDRSQIVSRQVFRILSESVTEPDEAPVFEGLLTRTTGGTRSAAITLLLNQSDDDALRSAARLLESSDKQQRLGALDLLVQMREAGRSTNRAQALADTYQQDRARLGDDETKLLGQVLAVEAQEFTLADGLGLMDPDRLTPSIPPRPFDIAITTPSHQALLESAGDLVEAYKDTTVQVTRWDGTQEELYGNLRWPPKPDAQTAPADGLLADVWADWFSRQTIDAFDLERALATIDNLQHRSVRSEMLDDLAKRALPHPRIAIRYRALVSSALWWLWQAEGTSDGVSFFLDGYENALSMVPDKNRRQPITELPGPYQTILDWRSSSQINQWRHCAHTALTIRPDLRNDDLNRRLWELSVWLDRPAPQADRFRPEFDVLATAYELGAANRDDAIDHLVGPRPTESRNWAAMNFRDLGEVSRRRVPEKYRGMQELVADVRDRIIEVELMRGDVETPASQPALSLRSVPGAAKVVEFAKALGRASLIRGWSWNGAQRSSVLSRLIRVSYPDENDTPAGFAVLAAEAKLSEKRLLEVAMYAPQWARHVEHALGWEGLEEAVYWLHAHTKDSRWSVEQDIREEWAAEIASRTPLTANDLVDGAVDVNWFHQAIDRLGEERWAELLKYVKFTSGGGGHKRAEVFGEALRGEVNVSELAKRISEKRHQDSVRALGLIPIDDDADLVARYQMVQEFRQGARQFGSQRQTSERRAADIALENLARTAGYPDPIRLQWELETREIADLAAGPVTSEVEDYSFVLSIDELGKANLLIARGDKKLKSVPARLRKHPDVVVLRDRSAKLRKQVSRVRSSLDEASVRGDAFTADEVARLYEHPILRPMLSATIFTLPDGRLGLPIEHGSKLQPVDGPPIDVGSADLRLAHPVDLLASDDWAAWQHRCFVEGVIQPFKQVFRELYVLTAAETADGKKSSRYAGHQLNPSQAKALFASRGWVTHPDGYTLKTFHRAELVAMAISDLGLFTAAEVEGATLEYLLFHHRHSGEPIALGDVPPRLFSEVMRDLDLVVSVAHMGGVDPEASASTVEMRAALVRETATLLSLDNVRFADSHVIVEGKLANYSIHLGSGQVHRQPGGAVCIIPVSAQHRGRLFLPFADDDPRTAEVVSKTMMLARDDEIKDPTILEQLVR